MQQKKSIKISFITPCYNCEKTIDETVKSILNLNLPEFEICMVDDGSKDRTYKLIKNYQKKYPNNIKIGKNQENRGGGYTRNVCFSMSKYPYIFLLDSDNVLRKEPFSRLLDEVEEEDNLIAFETIKFFYSTPFKWIKLAYKDLIFKKMEMNFNDLRRTMTHPVVDGNYLYKREVFEKLNGYETDLGALESWSFGYKALVAGYKYKIVKGASYFHRVHRDSYWFRELDKNFENLRTLLLRFPEKFSPEEVEEIKKTPDVEKFLIKYPNDFFQEKVNFPYSIPLKIYGFLFFRKYYKK
jgi:glycosyltransferase involved in cell wall biosynthesis